MGTGGASSTYPPTAVLRSGGNYYVTRADAKLYKGSLISAVYDATPINISTLTVVESLISASGILLAGGEADGSAAVARSTDLGDTWSHATLDSGSVTTLYTLSNGRILASADEDDETRIYSSDDAGVNWTLRDTVATSDAYQIFFGECPVSPGNVYYVSRKGVAKYSSNYGESFTSAGGALSAAGAMRVSAVWGAQPIANGLCVLAANWDGKVGLIRMSHPGQTISDISFNWMQIDHTLDFPSAGFFRAANTIQPYSPIGPSSAEKAIYGFRACVGPNPREIETPAV